MSFSRVSLKQVRIAAVVVPERHLIKVRGKMTCAEMMMQADDRPFAVGEERPAQTSSRLRGMLELGDQGVGDLAEFVEADCRTVHPFDLALRRETEAADVYLRAAKPIEGQREDGVHLRAIVPDDGLGVNLRELPSVGYVGGLKREVMIAQLVECGGLPDIDSVLGEAGWSVQLALGPSVLEGGKMASAPPRSRNPATPVTELQGKVNEPMPPLAMVIATPRASSWPSGP
jgi:hypothetical protein